MGSLAQGSNRTFPELTASIHFDEDGVEQGKREDMCRTGEGGAGRAVQLHSRQQLWEGGGGGGGEGEEGAKTNF